MADTRPRRNLPPVSEPWGRSVDDDLKALQQSNERLVQDSLNSFKMVNSTMKTFAAQIESLNTLTTELAAAQATLTATQATLSAQQATLSTQQSTLTATVAELTRVSGLQVTGASASNVNTSPIGIGNGGNYVGASTVVPAGFTRAVVSAQSSMRIVGAAGMAAYLAVNINGSVGGQFPVFGESNGSATTAASVGHAATLTGLSGGQTITVWARTTSVTGVSGAYISNTASFIFLK